MAFNSREWNNGLFDVCKPGAGACCYAFCCTPCAAAQQRTTYDTSNCFFNALCVNPLVVGNLVREGYGIEGGCVGDILTGLCCGPCSVLRIQNENAVPQRESQRQPAATLGQEAWRAPFFACDCYACCCPMCAGAQARTDYDGSNCLFNALCINGALLRSIVREGYGIEGNWVMDCLLGSCFAPCVICQVRQEVQMRGPKKNGSYAAMPASPQTMGSPNRL
eukprot:TRINITY_DN267_c0_g1_i5.p1 TRINITY_DN267_c0_g1~~TRINITY_DN267_c0_g1_i5.p1  ORF type:complete len:221 (+),score=64.80 TRINITY_DN267_c0_g1_i5:63-725(+)